MAVVLTLGPLLFADFEVPESIPFGGEQMLVVKKLVGGDRVIQAMGRDDDEIRWTGRFRGAGAEIKARLADYTRIQGLPVVLAWSTFRYLVVIKTFKGNFEQPFEIPYSISCEVVQDLTTPLVNDLLSIDSAISSDINQVVQVGAQLNIPGITSAVSSVASASSAVGSFEGVGAQAVSGMQGAIATAMGLVGTQSDTLNGVVASSGTVAGMTAGSDPASLASTLTSQADAFANLGSLSQISSYLQRASVNISNAATGLVGNISSL